MKEQARTIPLRTLQRWQLKRLGLLRTRLPSACGPGSVTVVAYHFWEGGSFDAQFDFLECSIREAWHHCGLLKTVLVVNRLTRRLEDFAAAASDWVKLDLCPDLVPGNLYSMSVDCISQLHRRFDTAYALIVQNDGFPIRSGLEAFLEKYDYIGAPWVFGKDDWITRLLLRHRHDVGNGGFSLRSKSLCEQTAWYFQRKYKRLPQFYFLTEDYFICKTLPSFEKRYREWVRIAPPEVAAIFSLEDNIELHDAVQARPFGFHGPSAFDKLLNEGRIEDLEHPNDAAHTV